MIDLVCSLGLGVVVVLTSVAYAYRLLRSGPTPDARVARADGSVLLPRGLVHMGAWTLRAVARRCASARIPANAVTWISLVLAVLAAFAMGSGHFGAGAALSLVSFVCDAIDGPMARVTGTAGDSGDVFDAAVDRYAEMFMLGGVAFFERLDPPLLVLALSAIAGGMMVSYSIAKAQSFGVPPRRGAMRLHERAPVLVLGAALVPLMAFARDRWDLPGGWVMAPLVGSLGVIGVVGNISAFRSLHSIAVTVARRRSGTARNPAHVRGAKDVRAAGL